MLCGGGVHISQAAAAVSAFAKAQGMPVAHTMTGKGAVACTDPLSAGLFGRYDRIANGLIEGINSLVQAAKAKARGYRSTRTLKAITYLIAGKLDLKLPT